MTSGKVHSAESAEEKAERAESITQTGIRLRSKVPNVFYNPNPLASSDLNQVIQAVKANASDGDLLSVQGVIERQNQIIKYKNITFQEGSQLVLNNPNVPWIAIVSQRILFNAPQVQSAVKLFTVSAPVAQAGTRGSHGVSYDQTNTGGSGKSGGHGGAGNPGEHGQLIRVPDIYIFTGEIKADLGDPDIITMNLNFPGHQGSMGGQGGQGGNGGSGERGQRAVSGGLGCKQGAKQGGNGGNCGPGGRGGDGGSGSDGSAVTLYGTLTVLDRMSYWGFNVEKGLGGLGGNPGIPGNVGPGGLGGANDPPYCSTEAHGGYDGRYPNPSQLGKGTKGSDGSVGSITYAEGVVNDFW